HGPHGGALEGQGHQVFAGHALGRHRDQILAVARGNVHRVRLGSDELREDLFDAPHHAARRQAGVQLVTGHEQIRERSELRLDLTEALVERDLRLLCPLRTAQQLLPLLLQARQELLDRKSTRLNSSHVKSSYAVFCWKKKNRT